MKVNLWRYCQVKRNLKGFFSAKVKAKVKKNEKENNKDWTVENERWWRWWIWWLSVPLPSGVRNLIRIFSATPNVIFCDHNFYIFPIIAVTESKNQAIVKDFVIRTKKPNFEILCCSIFPDIYSLIMLCP